MIGNYGVKLINIISKDLKKKLIYCVIFFLIRVNQWHFLQNKLQNFFSVEGQEILDNIKDTKEPVVFVSGHFNNFELMAMQIEKSGINLAAIYRPLNNTFLNVVMERIRKKHICQNQIKKGRRGTRELLNFFKNGINEKVNMDN